MKKIPETFELDEEDIKEAIEYWLNNTEYADYDEVNFKITFKATEKRTRPTTGPIGGMTDDVVTTVVSAVAVIDD